MEPCLIIFGGFFVMSTMVEAKPDSESLWDFSGIKMASTWPFISSKLFKSSLKFLGLGLPDKLTLVATIGQGASLSKV